MHLESLLTKVGIHLPSDELNGLLGERHGDQRGTLKQYKQYISQDKLGHAAVTNSPRTLVVQRIKTYILFMLHEGTLVVLCQSFPCEIQDATWNPAC